MSGLEIPRIRMLDLRGPLPLDPNEIVWDWPRIPLKTKIFLGDYKITREVFLGTADEMVKQSLLVKQYVNAVARASYETRWQRILRFFGLAR